MGTTIKSFIIEAVNKSQFKCDYYYIVFRTNELTKIKVKPVFSKKADQSGKDIL